MADNINTVFIAIGHDGKFGVLFDAVTGIHQLAIHSASQRCFRQAGANVGGDVMNGYGFCKTTMTAIRQGYDGHEKLQLVTQR